MEIKLQMKYHKLKLQWNYNLNSVFRKQTKMSNAEAREAHAFLKTYSSPPVGARGYVVRLSPRIQRQRVEICAPQDQLRRT